MLRSFWLNMKGLTMFSTEILEQQTHTNSDGQSVDGFTVIVTEFEPLNGSYRFTHAYNQQSAIHLIGCGEAYTEELNS